jgi:hypothetical protein
LHQRNPFNELAFICKGDAIILGRTSSQAFKTLTLGFSTMTTSKYFAELRRQNRFKLREGIIVAFQKPSLLKLGRPRIVKTASIIDINRRGLAFQYISHKMWPTDFNKLLILQTTDEIEIDNVPYVVISDFKAPNFTKSKPIRKCGVKFGELTLNQAILLNHLLLGYSSMIKRPGTCRRICDNPQYDGLERRAKNERRKSLP